LAVPKTLTLPAIPIRDMVLFPGARVPFVVGRAASVRTLELAIKAGDHLLMLTQKDAKVETPGQEDLYTIGTLALVESVIALPKDYYKVGVKGIARVTLRRYDDSGEVIQAEAYLLPEPSQAAAGSIQTFHQAVETFLGRNSDASRLLSRRSWNSWRSAPASRPCCTCWNWTLPAQRWTAPWMRRPASAWTRTTSSTC